MTTSLNQASAKDRVLAWVREKNPKTVFDKHDYEACDGPYPACRRCHREVDNENCGVDMGLQEITNAFMLSGFSFALNHNFVFRIRDKKGQREISVEWNHEENAHNQYPEFYESLLPLIS
jgi:hypothetical protein